MKTALIDLDLNGDGVIDQDEFLRWFSTGMKSYNSASRSFLKYKKGGKGFLTSIKGQVLDSLKGGNIKIKKHEVTVSFNDPSESGTVI